MDSSTTRMTGRYTQELDKVYEKYFSYCLNSMGFNPLFEWIRLLPTRGWKKNSIFWSVWYCLANLQLGCRGCRYVVLFVTVTANFVQNNFRFPMAPQYRESDLAAVAGLGILVNNDDTSSVDDSRCNRNAFPERKPIRMDRNTNDIYTTSRGYSASAVRTWTRSNTTHMDNSTDPNTSSLLHRRRQHQNNEWKFNQKKNTKLLTTYWDKHNYKLRTAFWSTLAPGWAPARSLLTLTLFFIESNYCSIWQFPFTDNPPLFRFSECSSNFIRIGFSA